MPRRIAEEEEWNEDWDGDDDDEGDEFGDEPVDGDDDLMTPCPHCQRPIFDESERCPHCEKYLSEEDAPRPRKPWWIILGAIACLYVVYRWILLGR